ncbi:fumarylacetoacetate hydrolase family protein [Amycolatopsis rhabdoformis]|uniref:Fumarylacetoacetate hydrolase family protein n=1 Tax=Amycolatopsis rhabdoformis TaxID=1448059 RepID=A0ABZ1HUA3_9PSEU|nr:fumarylacetoacetate hydrolase family protein [Amycolatopsis rhabdoformis]WSE25994.1 fumarylacetoacetate hydrolase family protein [Amycolatopsis rhabdoformis]
MADDLAELLFKATRGGPAVAPVPLSELGEARAVARATRDLTLAAGDTVAGYKVGLTNQPARDAYGATEPAAGCVYASTVLTAGETVPTAALFAPRAEIEIAFVLGRTLSGPGVTADDVRAATDAIAPAFEIVDSRWDGGPTSLALLVADNTLASHAVIGPRFPVPPDFSDLTCTLTIGDRTAPGSVSAVMNGDPLAAVAWLANHLAAAGEELPAGSVVLTGTLCAPTPFTGGETLVAEVSGMGTLTLPTS